MGCWGMGIAQSDEFCEVYEEFMHAYDNTGKMVFEITNDILKEYHAEFDDEDGVMHDVYFALAKAEWMCCEQSELVLNRVKEIVESGANIAFYKELEATDSDLKKRQKNLLSFLTSISTPREKPRKRKPDPALRIKNLPLLAIGECYCYKFEEGYRVFVILDRKKVDGFQETVYCAILEKTFLQDTIGSVDFLSEKIGDLRCYCGIDFPEPSKIKKIGEVSVPANLQTKLLGEDGIVLGNKKYFKAPFQRSPECTVAELFEMHFQPKAAVYTKYGSKFMTYEELKRLIDIDEKVAKNIYICNFFNCNIERMKSTNVSMVSNVLGKYVVTRWLDYEYGQYQEQQEFSHRDHAANFAWKLADL